MNSLLKFLYHPMVALSLALHGLLLVAPFPSGPQPQPEAEPKAEAEAEAEVQISSLKSLTRPAPPSPLPSPKPMPLASPVVRPSAPRPPVLQPPPPAPPPTPIATPAPVTTPTPITPPTPLIAATPTPLPEEQELQDFLGQFQSNLGGVGAAETAGLGIPYYLFQQPELFFTPESLTEADSAGADPIRQEGIDDILWASRKRPDAVYQELQTLFAGFTFAEAGEYGGGSLYQVTKGSTVRFLNLVQSTDRTATFVVIWNRNPNTPTATAVTPVPPAPESTQ